MGGGPVQHAPTLHRKAGAAEYTRTCPLESSLGAWLLASRQITTTLAVSCRPHVKIRPGRGILGGKGSSVVTVAGGARVNEKK